MSTSPTKISRVQLNSALRDGFKERGWSKKTLGFSVDVAPSGWVQAPLEMLVSKEVDLARYGGVSLFASASIWSSNVTEEMKRLPPGCLDEVSERAFVQHRALPILAHVDFDDLTSSDWKAIQEAELQLEADHFFEVVDGPLRDWATERATPSRLLGVQSAPGSREAQQPANVRTLILLALQEGLIDQARELVAQYRPNGRSDTDERFALFERELAHRLPAYGPPARS